MSRPCSGPLLLPGGPGAKGYAVLRNLYTYSEIGPQLAAIRAGVGLGDALATRAHRGSERTAFGAGRRGAALGRAK